jgi:hypothetical protein
MNNVESIKRAGIRFDHCCSAVVPEIPHVQDVLYAMRLSDEQECYEFCVGNHSTYVVNVGIVIAAVGYRVLGMERYSEVTARTIIARAIIDLCPESAKLHGATAYEEALKVVGEAPDPRGNVRVGYCPACE